MRRPKTLWPIGAVCLLMLALLLALSIGVLPAFAQGTSSGSVAGVVSDPTGAVVSGANVALIDLSTGNARTTTTNDTGRYVFTNVNPGKYDITVTQSGFAIAKVRQEVNVGMVATVNVSLTVGSAAQEVVVEASGAELQTTNATVGTTMDFELSESLPGLSRDISGLAMMQPATTPVSGTSGVAGATAGSNADQNKFMLDGGNISSDMDGNNTVYLSGFAGNPITGFGSAVPNGVVPTPVESIEEFKVGVVGQGGDMSSAAGNQVQMVTRRGTNSWHGGGYEYYYGTNLSANSWGNGHSPSTAPDGTKRNYTHLPSRHESRFGAFAGGPVLPKFLGGKTYLFGFYQGQRFPNITILEKPMPSDLLRAGVIQVQNSTSGTVTLNGVPYAKGAWMPFNLNPTAVTVNGTTYQPANVCGAGGASACDPRGLGLNPIVNQMWSQWMPKGNDPSCASATGNCDSFNTIGYVNPISLPVTDNNWVFRLDHDFGQNWHFMSSYRYYKLQGGADTSQVDVGGLLGNDKLGQYTALRTYPSYPSYIVTGLTTTITPHVTNDFHWSYTYNWWKWNGPGAPVQPISGLGGAVEIGGESLSALIPYNVNTQSTRTRFWDGQDHLFRDDVSMLKGNHLLSIGGSYQRNFNWHDRNDNGQGIEAANVYQVADNSGLNWTGFLPPTSIVTTTQQPNYQSLAAQVLGIVGQPQTLYTRDGADLHLLPLGTHAQDKSTIPFYDVHFTDTWHMKPSFTLTYGLSYNVEMPPHEAAGRQVMLVDASGKPVVLAPYLAARKAAALSGQVYDPVLGFATVKNVAGGGRTYPYDPFYGGIAPHVSFAWNPKFDSGILSHVFGGNTVLRGGYSRIYGRLNGVNLVLVPLLGTGLMQAVSCVGAVNAANAVNGSQCLGVGGATPQTAFRIGPTDGLTAPLGGTPSATLPQPYFPGVGGNIAAAPGSGLDPKTRPNSNDEFTLSMQREISSKLFVEVGYIGKLIHNEFQEINMDAVPYMTTLGGQTFADAYGKIFTEFCGLNGPTCAGSVDKSGNITSVSAIQAQPFIEAVMGGPTSSFCKASANCTTALIKSQSSLIANNRVYELWAQMSASTSWQLGLTNPGMNPPGGCKNTSPVCKQFTAFEFDASNGYGNYNAVYGSLSMRNWNGITARSNFTWGRALGTGSEVQARSTRTVLDPWNIGAIYGPQQFDVKFIYNLAMNYAMPFYKAQKGIMGHLLGGWSVAPIFTAQSGFPLRITQTESGTTTEAFGQSDPSQGSIYNAVLINPGHFSGGSSLHYLYTQPSGTVGTTSTAKDALGNNTQWLNMFADPTAAYNQFRRLVLGVDTKGGGFGILRGFPRWNVDMTVTKDIRATERFGLTLTALATNVFNHFQPSDPASNISSPATFGRVSGQEYDSRQIEVGIKVKF